MSELGFIWKEGKTEGHKVFINPELTALSKGAFTSHSIDCGHNSNKPMKMPYIVKTIRVLKLYETELNDYLKERIKRS